MGLKDLAKVVIPRPLVEGWRSYRTGQIAKRLSGLSTAETFDQIYSRGYWGDVLSSGTGSHDHRLVQPYLTSMIALLQSFDTPPVLVDIGVGDFAVGNQLLPYVGKYVGCDVSSVIINRNRLNYKNERLSFVELDIAEENPPVGDVVTVRQVFQHLSNAQIRSALSRLEPFDTVVITEHVPDVSYVPNVDHGQGAGTRLREKSGVDVAVPPFSFRSESARVLCEVPDPDLGGVIRTTSYTRRTTG